MAYNSSNCDRIVAFAYDDQVSAQAQAAILQKAGCDVTLYSCVDGFRLAYNDGGTLASDDQSYVVIGVKS